MEKWFGFGDNGMAPRAATEELGCDKDSGDRRQQLDGNSMSVTQASVITRCAVNTRDTWKDDITAKGTRRQHGDNGQQVLDGNPM